MTTPGRNINPFLLLCIAALLAFGIGYIHHQWFFPHYFNGDAATMQILGKAILDEGSLLPKDFHYGNQLIFLRSSPFIALAMLLNFSAYEAFLVGSSLSIAFWGAVLACLLSVHFRSQKKGLLFSILLLIPLGIWDIDYVLGQQSHLANTVLALGFVILTYRWIEDKNKLFLLIGCACLFLITSESPIRGLLVLVPVAIAIALVADVKALPAAAVGTSTTFLLAYAANNLLTRLRPISLDYSSKIALTPLNMLVPHLRVTSREALESISHWKAVGQGDLSFFGSIAFASGRLLYFCFILFALWGVLKLAALSYKRIANGFRSSIEPNGRPNHFVLLAATLGMIVGACAVAALNPNSSRHYLWAVFLMRFCFLAAIYDLIAKRVTARFSGVIILLLTLFFSSWFIDLIARNWNFQGPQGVFNSKETRYRYETPYEDVIRSHIELNPPEAVQQIDEYLKKTKTRNVYGANFWRMMPLNTVLEDVNAQNLKFKDGEIFTPDWLDRPSWACAEGDVLYYLKNDPTDMAIKEKLKVTGGTEIRDGDGYSLWRGPRVWKDSPTANCSNTAAARPTP
ncbi:hypothetical protein [Variovorax sp. Sphag1AA]|uniref:hypothetical protein n=1 Tax=Variovorax sp. Sphag1AA TaxID=2587027 RepID=UPI0016221857|nr:hypothetical protein [Variovorax sp. Sphag1AA]MBB3176341.1 hypothetical protein [Variovorax sp. Sphag1AA]